MFSSLHRRQFYWLSTKHDVNVQYSLSSVVKWWQHVCQQQQQPQPVLWNDAVTHTSIAPERLSYFKICAVGQVDVHSLRRNIAKSLGRRLRPHAARALSGPLTVHRGRSAPVSASTARGCAITDKREEHAREAKMIVWLTDRRLTFD